MYRWIYSREGFVYQDKKNEKKPNYLVFPRFKIIKTPPQISTAIIYFKKTERNWRSTGVQEVIEPFQQQLEVLIWGNFGLLFFTKLLQFIEVCGH